MESASVQGIFEFEIDEKSILVFALRVDILVDRVVDRIRARPSLILLSRIVALLSFW